MALACPSQPEEPRPSATPSPPGPDASITPDAAGRVRFGVLGEPATLDPYAPSASDLTWALARPLFPSLFRFLPDGSTEPLLAESLEETDRGATVRLRDAQWTDGNPITARDVVASWSRARAAVGTVSGFGQVGRARAQGHDVVEFSGEVGDWEQVLATVAYVLPGGRHGNVTGGPFKLARRVPGLELVLEPDDGWFGEPIAAVTIRVQFIRTTGTMLALLEDGRLDAAAVPSTVNLTGRATRAGLEARSVLGWESIRVRFGPDLDRTERLGFLAALDTDLIQDILVRDDGAPATTLHPGPRGATGPYRGLDAGRGPAGEITVTSPGGDELGSLLLRAVYAGLRDAGVVAEASPIDPQVFYGEWATDDPSDASIRRASGAPGLEVPPDDARSLDQVPLFHVATFVVVQEGFEGPAPNPTFDGPLWNAHEWLQP